MLQRADKVKEAKLQLTVKVLSEPSSSFVSILVCSKEELKSTLKNLAIESPDEIIPGMMHGRLIYLENEDSHTKLADLLNQYLLKYSLDKIQCIIKNTDEFILNTIEACFLKYYSFDELKSKEQLKKSKEMLFVVEDQSACDRELSRISHVVEQVLYVRRLVNLPGNHFRPSDMAAEAYKLEQLQVNCKVLQGDDIRDMGCLTGVGQASSDKSKLIVLEWTPRPTDKRVIGLVGKGVTFDSGGLSIKTPSKYMETMKCDMAGGATVMGIIRAAAEMNLDCNLVGVIPCAENMISGCALRPGDILKSYSGQTVEVLNTDAEGRLILADALWYIQTKYSAQLVIDFATLTGAIVTALGNIHMGLFSNDDELANILLQAGLKTGELLWRLPLSPEYDKYLDSKVADMQNIAPSSAGAGSITAAQFLKRFVKNDCRWAHIDFAGTAYTDSPGRFHEYGASGDGVRLILEALPKLTEILEVFKA